MRKIFIFLLALLALVGCDNKRGTFLETVQSQNDHKTTLQKLIATIKDHNLTYFKTIDHRANAHKIGMDLKPESVVVFGNPRLGTVLMNCNPSMGLELPLKVLVSTNYEGITTLTYTNPEYWSLKHNIKDKQCLSILLKAKSALKELSNLAAQK